MDTVTRKPGLILASGSPRRSYLLRQAGLHFTVIPSEFDESSVPETEPADYVTTLSRAKAMDVARHHTRSWVLGADTIVLIDGRILGKPASREGAREMLMRLSGQTHQVLTGFCICHRASCREVSRVVTTEVRFKDLTAEEIEWYIHTEEPFDKAGAYAIQGLGTFIVKSITGSYTNVVGLPVCEVIGCLIREGVIGFENGSRVQDRGEDLS